MLNVHRWLFLLGFLSATACSTAPDVGKAVSRKDASECYEPSYLDDATLSPLVTVESPASQSIAGKQRGWGPQGPWQLDSYLRGGQYWVNWIPQQPTDADGTPNPVFQNGATGFDKSPLYTSPRQALNEAVLEAQASLLPDVITAINDERDPLIPSAFSNEAQLRQYLLWLPQHFKALLVSPQVIASGYEASFRQTTNPPAHAKEMTYLVGGISIRSLALGPSIVGFLSKDGEKTVLDASVGLGFLLGYTQDSNDEPPWAVRTTAVLYDTYTLNYLMATVPELFEHVVWLRRLTNHDGITSHSLLDIYAEKPELKASLDLEVKVGALAFVADEYWSGAFHNRVIYHHLERSEAFRRNLENRIENIFKQLPLIADKTFAVLQAHQERYKTLDSSFSIDLAAIRDVADKTQLYWVKEVCMQLARVLWPWQSEDLGDMPGLMQLDPIKFKHTLAIMTRLRELMAPYLSQLETAEWKFDRNIAYATRSNRILWKGEPKSLGFVVDWYIADLVQRGIYN